MQCNKNIRNKTFRILSLLSFFLLLHISSVFANDIFFKADLAITLDKEQYSPGDNLNAEIVIYNMENFPIGDLNLIVQIVKGCASPTYPSQFSDCDNVFHEEIIKEIKLPSLSSRKVFFNYTLPKEISNGTYRLDVFLETGRTHVIGIPSIFLPGKQVSFEVEGSGSYPDIKILRTKTNIKNETGPIGVGASPNEKISLEVFLSSEKEKTVDIYYSLCEWKDTPCEKEVLNNKISQKIYAGEQKINLVFNAPTQPGVYSIPIIVKENEKILSLYRSRLIVYGKDARIRKLYPDKSFYKNEKATITLVSSGSPDHYKNPEVKDALTTITLRDLNSGKEYKKEIFVDYHSGFSINKNEEFFFINGEMNFFEICGEIKDKKTEEIYDSYCYRINSYDFIAEKEVDLRNKKFSNNFFEGDLCFFDKKSGLPLSGEFVLILTKDNNILKREEVEIKNCKKISYDIESEKKYELIVNNKEDGEQFKFELLFHDKIYDKKIFEKFPFTIVVVLLIIFFIVILVLFFQLKRKKIQNEA